MSDSNEEFPVINVREVFEIAAEAAQFKLANPEARHVHLVRFIDKRHGKFCADFPLIATALINGRTKPEFIAKMVEARDKHPGDRERAGLSVLRMVNESQGRTVNGYDLDENTEDSTST